ncbi:MAG: alpha-glucoside transport system permease protein [Chloroflexota bacterium]|jgi:alpha-glucoside transport system permease protein|nr:alpha-glucoside transport system permease protein [Chloroflexota bacterium]
MTGLVREQAHPVALPQSRPHLAIGRLPLHFVMILITLVWITPTAGLLISSFRPPQAVNQSGWWTALQPPFTFTIENYQRVLTTNNLGASFINSLFVSIPATVIPILIAAFAAYAFAWMSFPGRTALFLVVVGLLVVPLQMTLIPILQLFTELGLTGTFVGIWLAHTGYGLPFATYLLRNFMGGLPREMLEAAYIDGASRLVVFFRLVLPVSVPAIASLAIFQFLWVWNDLLVALVYLGGSPDVAPMTVTVSNLVNSLGQNWQLLTAAAFLTMILPLALFFTLQQYFVRGILAGSVKG